MGGCATKPRDSNLESLSRENPISVDQASKPIEVDPPIEEISDEYPAEKRFFHAIPEELAAMDKKIESYEEEEDKEQAITIEDKVNAGTNENGEEPLVDLSEPNPVVSNSDGDVNEELNNANTDIDFEVCEPSPDASQGPPKDLSDENDKAGDVGDPVSDSETMASTEKNDEIVAEAQISDVVSDEKSLDSTPTEDKNAETSIFA